MKMRIAPLWLALAGVCLAWIPPARRWPTT